MGRWRDCVVIGGGFALFIYKLYLADPKLENVPVGTRDIDSLISRKVPEVSKKNIAKHLNEAGFTPVFKDVDVPATESYVKEIEGIEIEIEFFTDSSTRNDKNKNVEIAGIVAQPLSYLTMSLQTTMEFQTYSHETGKVVSPGAWIFHKGLTFTKRKSPSKMLKDLYGIWYVLTQLGTFSDRALIEFNMLIKQHPKWFETLRKNLLHWMDEATPAEWDKLEAQDPSGKLKKLNFELVAKKILIPTIRETSKISLAALIVDMKGKALIEKVKEALAAGADVNDDSRNKHRPLQLALAKGYTEVARLLIEHGADLYHRDRSGQTPIQAAINHGQFQNAKLMIKKGVPFNRKNLKLEFDYVKHYQFIVGN